MYFIHDLLRKSGRKIINFEEKTEHHVYVDIQGHKLPQR